MRSVLIDVSARLPAACTAKQSCISSLPSILIETYSVDFIWPLISGPARTSEEDQSHKRHERLIMVGIIANDG